VLKLQLKNRTITEINRLTALLKLLWCCYKLSSSCQQKR